MNTRELPRTTSSDAPGRSRARCAGEGKAARGRRGIPAAVTVLSVIPGLLFVAASAASATPSPLHEEHYGAWALMYPDSLSGKNVFQGAGGQGCQLCHWTDVGDNGWNEYGWRIRIAMTFGDTFLEAMFAAERLDSDADPTASLCIEEIYKDTQPGWTKGAANTIYFWDGSTLPNQPPPSVILGGMDPCLDAGAASQTTRLGSPPNPNAFLPGATAGPVLGRRWDPRVTPFHPGTILNFVAVDLVGPLNIPTGVGTLLINPPTPQLTFFNFSPGSPFSIPIPAADCGLLGLTVWSQGGSVSAGPTIALANALDLVLGTY